VIPLFISLDLDTTKKQKANDESTSDDIRLTAKQKKKAAKARKLGMFYQIINNDIVIHPKILFKQFNDFANMKDARNLLLTALDPSGKQSRLAEMPDFPGVVPVTKTILIDLPIFDPNEMKLPMEARILSKESAPEAYQEMVNHPIYRYIKQDEVLGLVSVAGFDQYKRVHDRFLDLLEVPLSKGELKKKREEEDKGKDASSSSLCKWLTCFCGVINRSRSKESNYTRSFSDEQGNFTN
jgi:hypothetical protein